MPHSRRVLLAMMASLPIGGGVLQHRAAQAAQLQGRAATGEPERVPASEWNAFRRRYLAAEGRVVDTAKAGISHSEGQSYAMLIAVHMEDRAAFDLAWGWARTHLRRRGDHLMAWRWDPHSEPRVTDLNNATDGDLVAAWALARAGALWSEPAYVEEARRIARDLLQLCTVEWNNRLLLLPGAQGFRFHDRVVVNLSYYAWGALRALGQVLPHPAWARLEADGLALLEEARFGRFGLPPDWLEVGARGSLRPAPGWPARFSWDAVRIPLHLAWAGAGRDALLDRADRFWSGQRRQGGMPAWTELDSGVLAPYPGHAGLRAVAHTTRHALGLPAGAPETVADAPDYYGAALVLLSRIAVLEAATTALVPLAASHGPIGRPAAAATPGAGETLAPRPIEVSGAASRPAAPGPSWRDLFGRWSSQGEAVVQQAHVRGLALSPRVAPPRWTPHGP